MRVVQDNLRAAIERSGKSVRQIAAEVPCHPSMLNHLVAGRRTTCTFDLADSIEKVLDAKGTLFVRCLSSATERNARSVSHRGEAKSA